MEPVVPGYLEHAASRSHWERIGVRRRRGVCVPLSSLRSARDCGLGDVGDLPALIDWCVRIGAEVIQLLPVNDMGLDACPYSALSAFALDPVFAALDRIPGLEGDAPWQQIVRSAAAGVPDGPRVDWAAVRRVKGDLLRQAWARLDGPSLRETLAAFRAEHPWLEDYLPYRVLKEVEGYQSWEAWGPRYSEDGAVERAMEAHAGLLALHLFTQWVLDGQFRGAREYAASRGISIEGDIPILVSRDSADVWRKRHLFHLDVSAGAPPDMYAQDGQNWGFPTYQWDRMAESGYAWWRERLRHAERYFDLYRMDHVVGFFRIWTIPAGERTGRNGAFVPADESTWGAHGRRILEMMLESSRMLPLAEDLGTIPDVCRETLRDLGICGFKVQRWEKRWNTDRRFIPPGEYNPLSMATLSTHDSDILAQWWAENPSERDELHALLGHSGAAPADLTPDLHRDIVRWLSGGSSLFMVLLLQELLWPAGLLPGNPADHRINLPGVVNATNWTWRSPVATERLLADDALAQSIRASWTVPV